MDLDVFNVPLDVVGEPAQLPGLQIESGQPQKLAVQIGTEIDRLSIWRELRIADGVGLLVVERQIAAFACLEVEDGQIAFVDRDITADQQPTLVGDQSVAYQYSPSVSKTSFVVSGSRGSTV